jgi:peptidoglycan/LPS O-acetylase OafA/YrhL
MGVHAVDTIAGREKVGRHRHTPPGAMLQKPGSAAKTCPRLYKQEKCHPIIRKKDRLVTAAAEAAWSAPGACRRVKGSGTASPEFNVSKKGHIGALDGLRGIACLLIFAGHFIVQNERVFPPALLTVFSQYWSGVDLFFVLSGFVIFLSLERLGDRGFSGPTLLRHYLTSRAFRILPVYALFLLALFGLPGLDPRLSSEGLFLSSIPKTVYLFFGQSWYMAVHQRGGAEFADASWSLCAEVFLYLLAFLIFRFVSNRNRIKAMITVVAVSYAARLYVVLFTGNLLAAYLLPVCRMDGFMIGGIIAVLYAEDKLARADSRGLDLLLSLLFGVFVALSWAAQHFASSFSILFSYSFYSLFYSAILIKLLSRDFPILSRGPVSYIGTISYFIYLFHFPIIYWMSHISDRLHFEVLLNLVMTLGLTVCAATLSWYAMEKPLIRIGQHLNSKDARP